MSSTDKDHARKDEGPAPAPPDRGIVEEIIGPTLWPVLVATGPARWLRSRDPYRRDVALMTALASLVFIPWLGAVGLWDPWETHYGEVARLMIARRDAVYPWWEGTPFFSKPPGLMWLEIVPMLLAGTASAAGPVGRFTEWMMRLPVAALAIAAVAVLSYTCGRIFNRRVGLVAGFALCTSPLYFFMARQAITDLPFVATMVCALCCFAIAELDPALRVPAGEPGAGSPDPKRTAVWWYAFYALCALSMVFKGLLGFALPGAVILAYAFVTWDWALLRRARIPSGVLLFALVTLPWLIVLSVYGERDDEGKTFFYRYLFHDHFNRLAVGVHTTTPNTTFVYFLEQIGFGIFPWVALVPGALAAMSRVRPRNPDPKSRALVLFALWALAAFAVVTLSATKFHHYGFAAIPPLCALFGVWADRLWEEGLEAHSVVVLVGFVFFAAVAQNLWLQPKHLADLFLYNYERPYPGLEVNPKPFFAALFLAGGLWMAIGFLSKSRAMLVGAFAATALVFALYGSWVHWRRLSPHWAQRDIFWTYYEESCASPGDRGRALAPWRMPACSPHEPIAAYLMNWRGETFYSQNRVRQIKDPGKLIEFVKQPGREYVIVEQARHQGMVQTLGDPYKTKILDKSCNKFYLVAVD